MSKDQGQVGALERATQNRIIDLFRDHLKYSFLGHYEYRKNSNIEWDRLKPFLQNQGYSDKLIERAQWELDQATALGDGRSLYDANKNVYGLLRYGVKVKEGVGDHKQTVWLIDWKNPEKNDFSIAEEVTVKGRCTRRPDIVLYVNGIAVGVLELKRSTISVAEGILQNRQNQEPDCIRSFFTTLQLVMAGNDTEGLRYGVIGTGGKHYLEWKEDGGTGDYKLDRHLSLLCEKSRLLELLHDFMIYDSGTKKICRQNQYFGMKAAQDFIRRRQGGIIWHTQGSGKSLTMVWLAKWIRENVKDSRVLIITDRTELDEQIEKIFRGVKENIRRTKSGTDLVHILNTTHEWLICSLIHKFGGAKGRDLSDKDVEKYLQDIQKSMGSNFEAKGDIYVFVDECHRTQSGKLHSAMKKILPNALFIGFTGTPLLKDDKKTSLEVFGPYIHTYKVDEAVKDGVILDLRYEARYIDQNLTSRENIDLWFEAKTRGLNDFAKAQLKRKWGTLQKVLSSRSRLEKIVSDIILDMELRYRLADGRGNAILVSGSIDQACKFFEMFDKTDLSGKCAIITSYKPSPHDMKDKGSGEGYTDKLRQHDVYRKMIADFFDQPADQAIGRIEVFEQNVTEKFINDPGQMRLLIVVDKLLTGFDAPSATYLYIDKKMQNHGLFQAVCRVNRLDGDDKEYGYIIDYKDLFRSLENSIHDYTGGAFDKYDKEDVVGLLEDRLIKAKERLDETRASVKILCANVDTPKDTIAYIRYFCAEVTSNQETHKEKEVRRIALYKKTGSFIRAYAALSGEMQEAGYFLSEIEAIRSEADHFAKVRTEIKMASGDYIDMKGYELTMRHLIDSYIRAEESQKISAFDDFSLIQLIVERGEDAIKEMPEGIRKNPEAVAETIENNIHKFIIDEYPVNPKYYEKMSELLDTLINERKEQAIRYKDYLKRIIELTGKVHQPERSADYPKSINSPAKRALFDNLGMNESLALKVDKVVKSTKRDDFRGNEFKEREIEIAIHSALKSSAYDAKKIFELVKNQSEY